MRSERGGHPLCPTLVSGRIGANGHARDASGAAAAVDASGPIAVGRVQGRGKRRAGAPGAPCARLQARPSHRPGSNVESSDVIKGYEVAKGEYIELDPEELKAVALESERTIEIEEFVPAGR